MTTSDLTHSPPPSMELLAPAGTLSAFEAALAAGADAVYVGAPGLNARALTRDFTLAEIAAMTEFAHARGKKLYVAMNSLMKEEEIPLALATLSRLAQIGPDALILQDLGVLHLVRRFFPQLPVHASTLMTVNHSQAATYYQHLGFERIVLARELSVDEIRTIHDRCPVALEIFIHGAMCFSYSGLCRFSSLHGGKSSLRGQCVQPCRRRYDWLPSGKHSTGAQGGKSGGYLFSMNDLSGIELLSQARDAGVVSLKIEGRLKSVEYVRQTVRGYRLALEALEASEAQRERLLKEAQHHLDASMGRKRCTGFFLPGREDKLIIPRLSGSTGEVVGRVTQLEEIKGPARETAFSLRVTLLAAVSLGDRLRLYDERTGDRKNFTLRVLEAGGKPVTQARSGQTVRMVATGLELKRSKGAFQGLLFRVDVSGRGEEKSSGLLRQAARMQLSGPDPRAMANMLAVLGVGSEEGRVGGRPSRERHHKPGRSRGGGLSWWVKIPSLEVMGQRYPFKVTRMLVDLNGRNLEQALRFRRGAGGRDSSLIWALPPVLHEGQLAWYREAIAALRQQGYLRFQISQLGQAGLFCDPGTTVPGPELEIYGDYAVNALNSATLRAWAATGMHGVQFSLETDRANLLGALAHFSGTGQAGGEAGSRMRVGLLVHGRPPLFTARLDAPHFQGNRTLASTRGERYYLERREEAVYVRSHLPFSLLRYLSELEHSGLDYVVVDLSCGQLKRECAEVAGLLSGRGELPEVFSGNYAGILV